MIASYPVRMEEDPQPRRADKRTQLVAIIIVLALVATMAPFLLSVIF